MGFFFKVCSADSANKKFVLTTHETKKIQQTVECYYGNVLGPSLFFLIPCM